ncbi:MAG: hypothetical protein AAGC95_11850 [Pseudomonadota bacterium]
MSKTSLSQKFSENAAKPKKRKHLPPLSFRATAEERALLKEAAGKRPVSAYIREKLFADAAKPRLGPKRRPSVDDATLGQALALLGQSRLSSNLNQIAKAVNMGALPVSGDLQDELHAACADVRQMRTALIEALNIKPME